MRRTLWVYALFIAGLLLATRVVEGLRARLWLSEHLYVGVLGALFLLAGLWVGSRLWRRAAASRAATPALSYSAAESAPGLVEPLTAREAEVLALLAEGLSNQQIADRLSVSLSTVKTHISNLYSKLGAERRTQALARAQTLGLLRTRIPSVGDVVETGLRPKG